MYEADDRVYVTDYWVYEPDNRVCAANYWVYVADNRVCAADYWVCAADYRVYAPRDRVGAVHCRVRTAHSRAGTAQNRLRRPKKPRAEAASLIPYYEGQTSQRMRLEPGAIAAWRLAKRDRDLDAEDRDCDEAEAA